MKKILVVDDDRRMRRTLQIVMESIGFDSVAVESADQALERLRAGGFDLVLSDLNMPGVNGMQLLDEIKTVDPGLPVILITAYGTIDTAIEAMRKGASDYVLKPFDNENLKLVIRRALDLERFRSENRFLRQQVDGNWAEGQFLALPSMRNVASFIDKVAPTASPVLITGETGTGKELAARCIHKQSPRHDSLFVPLNCAALPSELLETELFGHVRGAFTGAGQDRQGKFQVADGGTLFLDEIGDMPIALQAKLLRVLEEGVIEPVGSNRRISVNVRIISATNQDLSESIAKKGFRSDLYYRLNTFELRLLPLRERIGDIAILAELLMERLAREMGKPPARLSEDALQLLGRYEWPGNVRELRTLMERAAVLATGEDVGASFFRSMLPAASEDDGDVPNPADETFDVPSGLPLGEAIESFERRMILQALDRTSDNKAEAARQLGISERNLWYKLKKHGL
jgi:two-component system response regulator AtoC